MKNGKKSIFKLIIILLFLNGVNFGNFKDTNPDEKHDYSKGIWDGGMALDTVTCGRRYARFAWTGSSS